MSAREPERSAAKPQSRHQSKPWRLGRLAALPLLAWLTGACDRPASAGSLPEWTPADHRSQDDDRPAGEQSAKPKAGPKGGDGTQLVELAWRQQCTSCHGAMGKGDGPMGPMVRAPDLTRDDWQAKTDDADIAAIIQAGKNKMPRFDLPEPVVRGLVARIRSLRGR
jgi:mono/diheme cytochrome c family protein